MKIQRRPIIISRREIQYKLIYSPEHPNARKDGYIFEHRLIMSKLINRSLYDDEQIHHIDGNGLNNNPNNLRLERVDTHQKYFHNNSKVLSEQDIKDISRKYQEGATTVELAKEYNCADGTIGRQLKKAGVKVRTPGDYIRGTTRCIKLTDNELSAAYKDYCTVEMTVTQLAQKYGMSDAGFRRALANKGYNLFRKKKGVSAR